MIKKYLNNKFNLKHSVDLPTSKSISNRWLVLQYLMGRSFDIKGLSDADDTQILKEITAKENHDHEVNVKNAGTCFRFLTALFSMQEKEVVLTGSEDMKKRPIKELVDALRTMGADIDYLGEEGFPPLKIRGTQLKGDNVEVNASISSQYITALLLIAPFLENGLTIIQKGEIKSQSYTQMTISLLKKLGVEVEQKATEIKVNALKQTFTSTVTIEKDWSSASYWYEYISLLPVQSKLQLKNLKLNSIQGDREIVSIYKKLGVITLEGNSGLEIVKVKEVKELEFNHDFSSMPDMVQTIAVTLVGLGLNGVFSGISHLIYKETNRIEALKKELSKLNYRLELLNEDSFELIRLGELPKKVTISTYKDHRMAMAFAPLRAVIKEVIIENPEVVVKSYPKFWEEFNSTV